MAKAYSYIRFSTPDQVKGDSLRRQTELSERYAEEKGLVLDRSLNLRDLGLSAFDKSNITKGALGQFLKLVESGGIEKGSYLLVESLDRISRAQVMDALQIFLGILNAGITIVTLADGVAYSKETANHDYTNLIMSIVIMSRATEESLTKSRRIRASWDAKRGLIDKKRLTSRCPYWMKPSNDKNGFVLIPDRVKVIKRIFQMAKAGVGNGTIVRKLHEDKVPPFSNKTDGWHESYIQKLIGSRSLYGEFQMSQQRDGKITPIGDPIPDYYPAVMTKEEWLTVNALRSGRRSRGGANKGDSLSNIFSGLLKCGYCGGPMVMGGHVKKNAQGQIKRTKYVACSNARRGISCKHIQWNYEDLESQVLTFCRSVDFSDLIGKDSQDRSQINSLERSLYLIDDEISSTELKLNNLIDALETSDQRPDRVLQRITDLESTLQQKVDQRNQIEFKLSRVMTEVAETSYQHELILNLLDKLKTLEGVELRELRVRLSERIRRLVESIHMMPGGSFYDDSKYQMLEESFSQAGFSIEEQKNYLGKLSRTPNKNDRFFLIHFKNGENVTVFKDRVLKDWNMTTHQEYFLHQNFNVSNS